MVILRDDRGSRIIYLPDAWSTLEAIPTPDPDPQISEVADPSVNPYFPQTPLLTPDGRFLLWRTPNDRLSSGEFDISCHGLFLLDCGITEDTNSPQSSRATAVPVSEFRHSKHESVLRSGSMQYYVECRKETA